MPILPLNYKSNVVRIKTKDGQPSLFNHGNYVKILIKKGDKYEETSIII